MNTEVKDRGFAGSSSFKLSVILIALMALSAGLILMINTVVYRGKAVRLSEEGLKDRAVALAGDLALIYAAGGGNPEGVSQGVLGDITLDEYRVGYTYVVGKDGEILYHPQQEKTGKRVENQVVGSLTGALSSGTSYTKEPGLTTYDFEGEDRYLAYAIRENPVDNERFILCLTVPVKALKGDLDNKTLFMVFSGILLIILSGISMLCLIRRKVYEPVSLIDGRLKEMADGNFVSVSPDSLSMPEDLKGITQRLDKISKRVTKVMEDLKDSCQALDSFSDTVKGTSDNISSSSGQLREGAGDMAELTLKQGEDIRQASVGACDVVKALKNVGTNAERLKNITDKMQEESKETAEMLDMLSVSSGNMGQSITDIGEKIGATSEAVERISEKTDNINAIAAQTNLLALNAAIEAARAGELGRGFAVVAEEIGKLAADSALSAEEIRKEMKVLLEEADSAVEASKQVSETNEKQREVLSQTIDCINNMFKEINETVLNVDGINREVEGSHAARDAVSAAMSALAEVSEKIRESSQNSTDSTRELDTGLDALLSTAGRAGGIAERLRADMGYFGG